MYLKFIQAKLLFERNTSEEKEPLIEKDNSREVRAFVYVHVSACSGYVSPEDEPLNIHKCEPASSCSGGKPGEGLPVELLSKLERFLVAFRTSDL